MLTRTHDTLNERECLPAGHIIADYGFQPARLVHYDRDDGFCLKRVGGILTNGDPFDFLRQIIVTCRDGIG